MEIKKEFYEVKKKEFCWEDYLKQENAIAAPVKLFKEVCDKINNTAFCFPLQKYFCYAAVIYNLNILISVFPNYANILGFRTPREN